MTNIEICYCGKRVSSIEADGHTDYNESGLDIVCAGISSILQTAVLGAKQLLGVETLGGINEQTGYIRIDIPKNLGIEKAEKVDIIFQTAILGLKDLGIGYKTNIKIKEKHDVY